MVLQKSLRFCECSLKIGFCVHSLEKRRAAFKKCVLAIEKTVMWYGILAFLSKSRSVSEVCAYIRL